MDYITTAHQAELNAAAKMRSWGFIDATSTTGGSDGGIDVRSRTALAQVKWRGGVAGRPDLQRLYGARGTDTGKQLLFFSASGYSKQAVDYANQVGIGLFTYDPTGEVTAVNAAASKIAGTVQKVHVQWWVISKDGWLFIGWLVALVVAVVFTWLQLQG
jgi:hypothetical protein